MAKVTTFEKSIIYIFRTQYYYSDRLQFLILIFHIQIKTFFMPKVKTSIINLCYNVSTLSQKQFTLGRLISKISRTLNINKKLTSNIPHIILIVSAVKMTNSWRFFLKIKFKLAKLGL